MTEREKLLIQYREIDILDLLNMRFNGSFEKSTIEEIIIEKIKKLKMDNKSK